MLDLGRGGWEEAEVYVWTRQSSGESLLEQSCAEQVMRSSCCCCFSDSWLVSSFIHYLIVVYSGCRTGAIHHHDVRVPNHLIGQADGHSQEVCGLQWSPDGKYLASGGNDNILNIWSNTMTSSSQQPLEPIHSFSQHQAAVKALAWCPWQPNVLASGGGTADRSIKFWNCNTAICLSSVDTKSQVSCLR